MGKNKKRDSQTEKQNKEQKQKKNSISYVGKPNKGDYPSPDKIGSRSSTIARAMASSIMPIIDATDKERRAIVKLSLGENIDKNIDNNNVQVPEENLVRGDVDNEKNVVITTRTLEQFNCVYCGKKATNLDHLFPFIKDKQPTGYFTEPANLVPCCDECNQKKGAKYWYKYMDELIDKADDGRKEQYRQRRNKLEVYCADEDRKLPTSNSKSTTAHQLSFDDSNLLDWWHTLRKSVINALDSAQIQIDAFKAGIKYSISTQTQKTSKVNVNKCFKKYFAGLIQKEYEELFSNEIKDNIEKILKAKRAITTCKNESTKKRHGDVIAETQKEINTVLKEKDEEEINKLLEQNSQMLVNPEQDNKRQKYYTLLEHGFRLDKNWEEPAYPKDAETLFNGAKEAFNKGFRYAKGPNGIILIDCIKKGWLKEIIVLSETQK